jgi:hypothetical protein
VPRDAHTREHIVLGDLPHSARACVAAWFVFAVVVVAPVRASAAAAGSPAFRCREVLARVGELSGPQQDDKQLLRGKIEYFHVD